MYNDLSPKQLKSFQESNARINIWEGSVRSGKTYISLWRFIKEIVNGPEGDYVIITRTLTTFRQNLLSQLEGMLGVRDVNFSFGKKEIRLFNKTVHIVGADDERAEAKIRGPTFRGAYVDEATIIPESVFKMLISRCAMGGARIFATTNPDSPYHWLKQEYLDGNPDVKSWQFTLDDNPKLPKEDKEYLIRQYRGLWYQRFIEGKWVQAEGAIYDFFDEKIHVLKHPLAMATYYILGIDYGTTNPCAFVLIGINTDRYPNIWVEDEYYFNSKVHQRQKTDSEYAADLVRFIENRHIRAIYLDPSAASFRAELLKTGVDYIYEAKNEVLDGIRKVSDFLNMGRMKVCLKCSHLIKEFQGYVWDPKCLQTGEDRPLKQNDHALDALRYAIYTHFENDSGSRINAKDIDRWEAEARGGMPNLPSFFRSPTEDPFHPTMRF